MRGMGANARKLGAGAVHLLTASGAVWGLLALDAIVEQRFRAALGFMLLAVFVDSVDGTLARRLRVAEALPGIDGTLLDNLVDYLNYAVVPACLLAVADLLPEGLALAGAALVALASAFQFAHVEAKTADQLFRGFPSYWNVVAFYLLILALPRWVNFSIVVALAALSLAPVYFPYPSRTPRLRRTTIALGALWGACLAVLLVEYPRVRAWLAWASLLYPAYHAALGLRLTARRRDAPRTRTTDTPRRT